MTSIHGRREPLPLNVLAAEIDRKRKALQDVEFYRPSSAGDGGFLEVLRRWNSDTPLVARGSGGGYYFRWDGKGIVIDPGCTFLQAFQRTDPEAGILPHTMGDINLVIVTHDHIDHVADMCLLVAILRHFNKHREAEGKRPHEIRLILSLGAYELTRSYLENPENRKVIRVARVLEDGDIEGKENILEGYPIDVACLFAQHKEVMAKSKGFGLKLTFRAPGLNVIYCDSGDTAYHEDLAAQYAGADILLLHVGTLEDVRQEKPNTGEHLCFAGTVKILKKLQDLGSLPGLILLGEWGQEFSGPHYRTDFTHHVAAAAKLECGKVLPVDLGMRIRLADRHICCPESGDFVVPGEVVTDNSRGEAICYRKD